jgi:hypothetical protein
VINKIYLQIVHGTGDGPFSDLVAVGVEDRDDGTTLCGVDVLIISLCTRIPETDPPCVRAMQWR